MIDESDAINPFPKWLEEVANDPLTVNTNEEGLSYECHGNHWSFAISQSQAEGTTADSVLSFLISVMQSRQRQIAARPGAVNPMVFYCWFDEQASHLCFSLVSIFHHCLPFGATVEETDDFTRIVDLFLSSRYHNGISLGEFVTEEEFNERGLPKRPPFVLLVATKTLPFN